MRYGFGCEHEDSQGECMRPGEGLCPDMEDNEYRWQTDPDRDYEMEFEREARRRLNGYV